LVSILLLLKVLAAAAKEAVGWLLTVKYLKIMKANWASFCIGLTVTGIGAAVLVINDQE
jgi:hypothetical protein